jgi:hypothetical protein
MMTSKIIDFAMSVPRFWARRQARNPVSHW